MRARTRCTRLAVALSVMFAGFSAAQPVSAQSWYANLSPEVQGATGSGFGTFSINGSILTIDVDWTGLSGSTTVAHIHCCTADPNMGTVGVAVTPGTLPLFPVGVTSGNYSAMIDLDLATSFTAGFVTNFAGGQLTLAQESLVAGFNSGRAYLNIHSSNFGGGEIRGFITQVPEPSTWMLTMLGVAMLLVASVWRRMHVSAAAL